MGNNEKQTEDFGALIGVIIVIILLLVGAFYFVNERIEKSREFKAALDQGNPNTSDEIIDIESTATSMNFDDLGADINNL
jgi:hypothetical protein